MKVYLDEDLSPKIAELLRNDGVDCISAHETEMVQASDLEQLRFSAHKKRCLVNQKQRSFHSLDRSVF